MNFTEMAERALGDKLLLFAHPAFFTQRDKDMKPRDEYADGILRQLKDKYEGATFVVCLSPDYEWLRDKIDSSEDAKGLDLRFFKIRFDAAGETTLRLRELLKRLGIRLRPIRNPRSVSFLNIHQFVVDERFQLVQSDDYDKLGVAPEKELTFDDMVKKRRQAAWP
jgi:hypothetical protein